MNSEPTLDELNGNIRRRMWTLGIVIGLLILGAWNIGWKTYRVDAAGYYYHCASGWDSMIASTNEPYPLGIQDAGLANDTLNEVQRDALALKLCHDKGTASVRTNLLWMVPLLVVGIFRAVALNKKVNERDTVSRRQWEERVKAAREIQG